MNDISIILALDPGKTTGVAIHNLLTDEKEFFELGFLDVCQQISDLSLEHGTNLKIIAESFIITPNTAKNSQAPWSLEVIGVARFCSLASCNRDLRLQSPASAKRFSSDQRLKMVGYYTPGKGHANDAGRHLLLFEATQGYLSKDILKEMAVIA